MVWPAIIAAGATLASAKMAQGSADKSMAFQKHMARHAHQYEVEDLRKAGLNPILSAMGKGATASGGAQAQIPDLGQAVATGLQAKRLDEEIKQIRAQTEKLKSEKIYTDRQAGKIAVSGAVGEAAGDVVQSIINDLFPQGTGQTASSALDAVKDRLGDKTPVGSDQAQKRKKRTQKARERIEAYRKSRTGPYKRNRFRPPKKNRRYR